MKVRGKKTNQEYEISDYFRDYRSYGEKYFFSTQLEDWRAHIHIDNWEEFSTLSLIFMKLLADDIAGERNYLIEVYVNKKLSKDAEKIAQNNNIRVIYSNPDSRPI
jgi:hypothetical protein